MSLHFLDEFFLNAFNLTVVNEDDDFFILGGSSLLLPQLVHFIWENTNIIVDIQDVFTGSTLGEIKRIVSKKIAETSDGISHVKGPSIEETKDDSIFFPLKHIWLSEMMSERENEYNIGFMISLSNNTDLSKLKKAIKKILEEEDSYNLTFQFTQGEIQIERKKIDVNIQVEEHFNESDRETFLKKKLSTTKFDLRNGPLYKVEILIDSNTNELIIFFIMHHIVIDQYSIQLFWKSVVDLYSSCNFEEALKNYEKSPLKDSWNQAKVSYLSSVDQKKEFWINKFVNFDFDTQLTHPLPVATQNLFRRSSQKISKQDFKINSKLFDNNTIFLTAYFISLNELFRNQESKNIVTGIPYVNRGSNSAAISQGFFVNMVPYSINADITASIDSLNKVKKNNMEYYLHQDVPLETILDIVPFKNFSEREHFINNVFIYEKRMKFKDSSLTYTKPYFTEFSEHSPKFPLSFYVVEKEEFFEISLDYPQEIFSIDRINSFNEQFKINLKEICEVASNEY
ncbi:hypothetical protein A5881_003611 [Enterococcus termitis]|nr:hypothetical protein A5881_003841 [Enterococcus termitis]